MAFVGYSLTFMSQLDECVAGVFGHSVGALIGVATGCGAVRVAVTEVMMGKRVEAPTPHAMWDESCAVRHLAPTLMELGEPVAALRAEEIADSLLSDARLVAVALGLNALVRRVREHDGQMPKHRGILSAAPLGEALGIPIAV